MSIFWESSFLKIVLISAKNILKKVQILNMFIFENYSFVKCSKILKMFIVYNVLDYENVHFFKNSDFEICSFKNGLDLEKLIFKNGSDSIHIWKLLFLKCSDLEKFNI